MAKECEMTAEEAKDEMVNDKRKWIYSEDIEAAEECGKISPPLLNNLL